MAYQIAKDKRIFSDEELKSDDPEYLKRTDYDLTTEDRSTFTVSLLTRQVELLTRKLDHALNRIAVLESLLDVTSDVFMENEDENDDKDVKQPTVVSHKDSGLLNGVVSGVSNAVHSVMNILTGGTNISKEGVESKTVVDEVVIPVLPTPTYLKFSYTDSVVMKLLDNTTDVREKYALETIRKRNGYGKMEFFKKYEGVVPPSEEELTVLEDKLEKLRLEGLSGLSQSALDFATFSAKCDNLITAEYKRDPPIQTITRLRHNKLY